MWSTLWTKRKEMCHISIKKIKKPSTRYQYIVTYSLLFVSKIYCNKILRVIFISQGRLNFIRTTDEIIH